MKSSAWRFEILNYICICMLHCCDMLWIFILVPQHVRGELPLPIPRSATKWDFLYCVFYNGKFTVTCLDSLTREDSTPKNCRYWSLWKTLIACHAWIRHIKCIHIFSELLALEASQNFRFIFLLRSITKIEISI